MADTFAPPPLSSHQGPAAGFVPPPVSSHQGAAPSQDSAVTDHLKNEGFLESAWNALKSPFTFMSGIVSGEYGKQGAAQIQRYHELEKNGTPEEKRAFARDVLLQNVPFASTLYKAFNGNLPGAAGDVAGLAALGAVPKVAGAAAETARVATNPEVVRAAVDVLPKGQKILKAIEAIKAARGKMGPPATPGEAYARARGIDWDALSADDRGVLEHVAKAQQNAAAAPPRPTAPPAAPQATAPTDTASRGVTLQQMLQEEIAARKGAAAPEPEAPAPQPMIGARTPRPVSSNGTPLRPPMATAPAPASPEPAVTPQPPAQEVPAGAPEPPTPAPKISLDQFGEHAERSFDKFARTYPGLADAAGKERLLSLADQIAKTDGGKPALKHLMEAMQYESAAAQNGIASGAELLKGLASGVDPTEAKVFTDAPYRGGGVVGADRARQIVGGQAEPPSPKRSLAQTEAMMARKAPAPLEEPRSMYTETGERKSPHLRAAEIENANRVAKVGRIVDAMKANGITLEDARNMAPAEQKMFWQATGINEPKPGSPTWGMVMDAMQKEARAAAKSKPAAPAKPAKPDPQEIARQLRDEMERSGTLPSK